MTRVKEFIDKRMTMIKLIFVFSVLIFVIRQLAKIIREVNGTVQNRSGQSKSRRSFDNAGGGLYFNSADAGVRLFNCSVFTN